ncbi:hypothetical protein BRC77_08660 [Halobacteriales archaeon QH_8_64_26]|nr:MAG: hypothetical protein BRC77_08660 [Halobacteriales archaeon QH_8_64_26]
MGAVGGAGTWAAFSDSETSSGNTVSAGTIDLASIDDTQIDAGPLAPDESGDVVFDLTNGGSVSGRPKAYVENVADQENGREDAELEADGDGSGELSEVLEVGISFSGGGSGSGTLGSWAGSEVKGNGSGDGQNLIVSYTLPASAGNKYQSDSVTFDVVAVLEQQTS